MPLPLFTRWLARPAAPADFLAQLPADLSPLIGQVLWNRKLTDPALVEPFITAGWEQLHDPLLMRDMDRAVARIRRALAEGERVAIYGDYDTDGVTGVTLLHQVLTALGLDVLTYIPKRLEEGYGLNIQAVEQLATQVQLLITIDCGISNVSEVARAQALGLDVIVLDHHTPPEVLPQGYAVVNPKQPGCDYPYKMLAGVGVGFKLVQALHRSGMPLPFPSRALLDVVALGTVADVAPLDGENRVLVKHGLKAINTSQRFGLRALVDVAGCKGDIDAQTIGFTLGPRLNAAGRLDDAILAYELLLADDPLAARKLAETLNDLNTDRQRITKEVQQQAADLVIASGKDAHNILVVDGADFPAGIVGLVAARLAERFHRPALLIERGETISRGSARSIKDFSIIEALTECGDLFEKFGGHAAAAGFSIRNDRLAELEQRLIAIGKRDITPAMLTPRLDYDGELQLGTLSAELVDHLGMLEPFGHGNGEPLWVSHGVQVVEARTMGGENQHLKLKLAHGHHQSIEAVWWRQGEHLAALSRRPKVDIAYTLEINTWNNRRSVQLKLKDLRLI